MGFPALDSRTLFFPGVRFQPSASIHAGQLVCITHDYESTSKGTPRVGPALVVGRMALPSDLVKRGAKGKALMLLHAWKDELWKMGGEKRPPRPRLLQVSPNVEEGVRPRRMEGDCRKNPAEVSDALWSALLESISVTLSKIPPEFFPPIGQSIFYETFVLPYRSPHTTVPGDTPVDIKHSGFESLTAFLETSAKEGLIEIKKVKRGVVVTGKHQHCVVIG